MPVYPFQLRPMLDLLRMNHLSVNGALSLSDASASSWTSSDVRHPRLHQPRFGNSAARCKVQVEGFLFTIQLRARSSAIHRILLSPVGKPNSKPSHTYIRSRQIIPAIACMVIDTEAICCLHLFSDVLVLSWMIHLNKDLGKRWIRETL